MAGYDKTSPVPDDVVANIVGNTVLGIGLAVVALGVLIVITDIPSYFPVVFEAITLLAVVRLIYWLHTYIPTNT